MGALALLIGALAGPIRGAEAPTPACCASGKRAGDQIWLISTRHLGCNGMSESLPDYRTRYHALGQWHDSSTEAFLASDDPTKPTVVYIHGNRYDPSDAVEYGWQVYYALIKDRAANEHVRLVIWSWPSDQQGGPLRDIRIKAARTGVESYYLARLLRAMDQEVETSLLGYSYGARVSLGALHLLGGGELDGRVAAERANDIRTYRVAMMAAGADDDSLLPGDRFDVALLSAKSLLNIYNSCDPVLKRYRFVDKCDKPVAMGYSGIYGRGSLGNASQRIVERDAAGIVGKSHEELRYLHSESIMRQVRGTLFSAGAEASIAARAGR